MTIEEAIRKAEAKMERLPDLVMWVEDLQRKGRTGVEAFIAETNYQKRFRANVLAYTAERKMPPEKLLLLSRKHNTSHVFDKA